jgi:aromatic prenyltransferase
MPEFEVDMSVTLDRLRSDLREYARLAQVDYNPAVTDPVFEALGELWTRSALGVRTTTHPTPQREVSVRLIHPGEADPLGTLQRAGLLQIAGRPMEQLLEAVPASVPVRWGVDLSVSRGVQKAWLVFPQVLSVAQTLGFPGMPESAQAYRDHLTRYGDDVGMVAIDFAADTLNLYSRVFEPGGLTADEIAVMLGELDFIVPTDGELALLKRTFNLYRTFSWNSPGMRRICLPVRCTTDTFPTHLDPVLERFVHGAPFPRERGGFVFYAAYSEQDRYYKVQAEYVAVADLAVFPGGAAPTVT